MTALCASAELFVHFSELVAAPAHWRAVSDDADTSEQIVSEFVGRLWRLEGIPFAYLVADNAMLPPESIRFFYLDQNWLDALTDGALGLGRIGDLDTLHDEALVPVLRRRAETTVLNHRRRQLGVVASGEPVLELTYTGFLMRSAVVSGWPGLEVRATETASGSQANLRCTGADVEMIRMDRLSSDVLICLFAGRIGCVQIHEPKEGINSGASLRLTGDPETEVTAAADGAGVYRKALRGLGIGGYPVGEFIEDAEVEVPLRADDTRVVEVDALRRRMIEELASLSPPAWEGTEAGFTSAQFSLQMVEGAGQQIFRAIDDPPRSPQAPRLGLDEQQVQDRADLNRFLFGHSEEEAP